MTLIAVDPGHGGLDQGAGPYFGVTEAWMVWDIVDRLTGFNKVLTRHENEDPSFTERAARAASAEACISIHLNSGDIRWSKPEVYYRGPDLPTFWLDWMDLDVTQGIHCDWRYPAALGKRLAIFDTARHLQAEWLARPNFVLRKHTVPTVLVEVGYLNDPKVNDYLQNGGTVEIAETLSEWIVNRISYYESMFASREEEEVG